MADAHKYQEDRTFRFRLTSLIKSAPQIQLWCWHCAPYKCSYYYYYYTVC